MNMTEQTIKTEYKFNGKILNVRVDDVRLPDGNQAKREIIEHSGGVGVIATTDENEVILVRQYRHPYNEIIYEIPAGKREKGENPLECGKRELKEEAGCEAKQISFLGKVYPTPAYCGEIIYIYHASRLSFCESKLDEGEFLEVEKIKLDKAVDMVLSGEITDSKTQIAILKVKLLADGGKI